MRDPASAYAALICVLILQNDSSESHHDTRFGLAMYCHQLLLTRDVGQVPQPPQWWISPPARAQLRTMGSGDGRPALIPDRRSPV